MLIVRSETVLSCVLPKRVLLIVSVIPGSQESWLNYIKKSGKLQGFPAIGGGENGDES